MLRITCFISSEQRWQVAVIKKTRMPPAGAASSPWWAAGSVGMCHRLCRSSAAAQGGQSRRYRLGAGSGDVLIPGRSGCDRRDQRISPKLLRCIWTIASTASELYSSSGSLGAEHTRVEEKWGLEIEKSTSGFDLRPRSIVSRGVVHWKLVSCNPIQEPFTSLAFFERKCSSIFSVQENCISADSASKSLYLCIFLHF